MLETVRESGPLGGNAHHPDPDCLRKALVADKRLVGYWVSPAEADARRYHDMSAT
jgi:hypothetical protein